jgi:ankyrin repeat protein
MKTVRKISIIVLAVVAMGSLPQLADANWFASDPFHARNPTAEMNLRSAAFVGDLSAMRRVIAGGAQIDWVDYDGWTPLFWAVFADRVDAAKLLLEKGANVNHKDKSGRTALYWAALRLPPDIIDVLLSHGAVLNVKEQRRGWTPLMRAARSGNEGAVKILLAKGADPNMKDRRGYTALRLAALYRKEDVAEMLLAGGAVPDPKTKRILVALKVPGFTAATIERTMVFQYTNPSDRYGDVTQPVYSPAVVRPKPIVTNYSMTEDIRKTRPLRAKAFLYNGRTVATHAGVTAAALNSLARPSGLSASHRNRAQAEQLLHQAVSIWQRICRDFPELSKQLQESARRNGMPLR